MNYLKALSDAIDAAVPQMVRQAPDSNRRLTGSQVAFEVVDADVQPDGIDSDQLTACSNTLFSRNVEVRVYFRVGKRDRIDQAIAQQATVMPLVYAALRNSANWGGLRLVRPTAQWGPLQAEDGIDIETSDRHVSTLPVRVQFVI